MCFSAQVKQKVKELSKRFDAQIDLPYFEKLFKTRLQGSGAKIPRALEASFTINPSTDIEKSIAKDIADWHKREIQNIEKMLFQQIKRQANAERDLKSKITKKSQEELRISSNKIKLLKYKLERLNDKDSAQEDDRIFPFDYAPLIIYVDGKRVIRPFRYLLRPMKQTESFDRKYGGCYNARRDNLDGAWWKSVYGRNHGILVIDSFFENVKQHTFEHRDLKDNEKEQNVVLQFIPSDGNPMIVPCLYDHNDEGKFPLDSFAVITDDPNPEVAAAGHNRTPIIMKENYIDQWLNTKSSNLNIYETLLSDKQPTYFRHQIAA